MSTHSQDERTTVARPEMDNTSYFNGLDGYDRLVFFYKCSWFDWFLHCLILCYLGIPIVYFLCTWAFAFS